MDKRFSLTPEVTEPFILTATVVPDEQRLCFWPQHFGLIPQWITLEPCIFAWMDRLCAITAVESGTFTPSVTAVPYGSGRE